MSAQELQNSIEDVLETEEFKPVNVAMQEDTVVVYYDVHNDDPDYIVQLIERNTNGDYIGETQEIARTVGLKFAQ